MNNKESSISQFRNQVFNEYKEYRCCGHIKLLQLVGEAVGVSQDIEMELLEW